MYFVTFRLADSMPREKLELWMAEREAWHRAHPEPHDEKAKREYPRLFPERFQKWLDAGHGECILARNEVKILVENALRHSAGLRYDLDEFCVMPNHVHVLQYFLRLAYPACPSIYETELPQGPWAASHKLHTPLTSCNRVLKLSFFGKGFGPPRR